MTVCLWSKTRADWITVENATSVERYQARCNGRITWCWLVRTSNGSKTFKCKDVDLVSVSA